MGNNKPLVVIQCITYNHERYIRATLEGFVMQRTNFPFVAVVHDDASTDGTADIIREFAEKYPHIIKPILETENLYSKHDGSLGQVVLQALDATGAKYLAYCEGDDYWTDPLKLQKQVDFLEANPEYSMCFHNAVEHWEDGSVADHLFAPLKNRDYDYEEIVKTWIVPTASVIIRKEILDSNLYKRAINCEKFICGDIILWLTAAELGKVHCTGEIMSVYRRHIGGVTFSKSSNQAKHNILHIQALPVIFGDKYKSFAVDSTVNIAYSMCLKKLRQHDYGSIWDYFLLSFKYAPLSTVKKFSLGLLKKIIGY